MNKLRVISRNKLNGEYKTEMMFYDKKIKTIENRWSGNKELTIITNHKDARIKASEFARSLYNKADELNLQDVFIYATYYECYSQIEFQGEIIERKEDFNLNKILWQNGRWT